MLAYSPALAMRNISKAEADTMLVGLMVVRRRAAPRLVDESLVDCNAWSPGMRWDEISGIPS